MTTDRRDVRGNYTGKRRTNGEVSPPLPRLAFPGLTSKRPTLGERATLSVSSRKRGNLDQRAPLTNSRPATWPAILNYLE